MVKIGINGFGRIGHTSVIVKWLRETYDADERNDLNEMP